MNRFKSILLVVLFFILPAPLFALEYTNPQLGFKVTLPNGLDSFSTNMRVKALISLGKMDVSKGLIKMIAVQSLGGPVGREDLAKKKDKPKNSTLEKAKWKDFDVEVFRVVETTRNGSLVTFIAQVPLTNAIQITVAGPARDERQLRTEMQTIVASVAGATNWVAEEEVKKRPQPQNYFATAIGVLALLVGRLRISRHYGLRGAGARVAGFLIIALGLVLPKLTAMALEYAHAHGVNTPPGILMTWVAINCAAIWIVIFILVLRFGNAYAKNADQMVHLKTTVTQKSPPPSQAATACRMCRYPIPQEEQGVTRTCPNCGADLLLRRSSGKN